MNKKLLLTTAILIVIAGLWLTNKRIRKRITPAIPLATVVLKDLKGNPINTSGFTGKPLIINFWASWCGPCRQELPGFENAKNRYGGKVNFLMASDESIDKIVAFKQQNNYTFFYAQLQKPFHNLGITSIPVTCFYDAKGTLVNKRNDPLEEEDLNKMIVELIK